MQTTDVAGLIFKSHPETERLLEMLQRHHLVEYSRGSYTANAGWVLTKSGRDFCLDNDL